jgi:hypothetical protein
MVQIKVRVVAEPVEALGPAASQFGVAGVEPVADLVEGVLVDVVDLRAGSASQPSVTLVGVHQLGEVVGVPWSR